MTSTKAAALNKPAVRIVSTYERMKRNGIYRVLSLIFGCITLVIVKLVQRAGSASNPAQARREELHKAFVEKGELAALKAEAEAHLRRKNQFFNKHMSDEELRREAEKTALLALEDKVNAQLELEGVDTRKTSGFQDTFIALLSKAPFFVFSLIVSFPMYILVLIYMMPYLKYTVDRLAMLVFVVLGVIILVFSILFISPSDPALNILGEKATPEQVANFREVYGLDKPYLSQAFDTVKRIATFDLGRSYVGNENIGEAIARKFPVTMQLAIVSMALALFVGLLVGIISAIRQYSAFDYTSMFVVLVALSIPNFWLGLVMVLNFSIKTGWLPSIYQVGNWQSMIMPAIVLGTGMAAGIARMTRSSMLEVRSSDYVMTAKAKGLSERSVTFRHILSNALIPIITMAGMQFGGIMGGSPTTEKVFSISGIGIYIVDKEFLPDVPAVVASVVYVSLTISLANLLVDILYTFVDPRIKTRLKNY
ncbi:ABC transporter permease [Ruminococcaceae bacterium OttesenSCG-928-D13]|nr:ABC transporter permease [Ruminococcaceae bacterium OttesenSCG-928-D13]